MCRDGGVACECRIAICEVGGEDSSDCYCDGLGVPY